MARKTPAELQAAIENWFIDRGIRRREATDRAAEIVLKEQIAEKLPDLSDDDAGSVVFLFDQWEMNTQYEIDDISVFDAQAYKCVQAHNSQTDRQPPLVPALWTPLRNTGGGGGVPDPWVQPTGAQDAYATGDRVTHPNPFADNDALWIYESAIDANTTVPGQNGDQFWLPIEAV